MPHATNSEPTYFTRDEVAQHNVVDDCWVISVNKQVLNITDLVQKHKGIELRSSNLSLMSALDRL
jgi:cytochrome b involved in lipid metabolism